MNTNDFAGMSPSKYNSVDMAYDGSNLLTTVTFRDEGGDIICVLTLTYDGSSNLTNVTRS